MALAFTRLKAVLSIAALAAALLTVTARAEMPGPEGFVWHDAPRAPADIVFTGPELQQQSLADYRGRVVLLNIWATWCPPCVEEMPSLDRLQAAYGGDDFLVLPLSLDREGMQAVNAFYETTALTALTRAVDPTMQALPDLKLRGLPTTILIDPEGREIGRFEGDTDWFSDEARALVEFVLNRERPAE